MNQQQRLNNLTVPAGRVDVVLDTDAYNEIDDQFAIAYLLRSPEKCTLRGICAAPFFNSRSVSAEDGMYRSYDEILKLLSLAEREDLCPQVYRGSTRYLPDEQTPVESDAAAFMAELADSYSPEHPLYIIAIGAITNVASAILKNPRMVDNCVVIWLGGHGTHIANGASEFNMQQDIAGARVVFGCGVPLVQLPCVGVVDHLTTSRYELEHWLKGKNALCDYLVENTVAEAESYAAGRPWTRVIWDVSAVAWLLDTDCRLMSSRLIPAPIPEYDKRYAADSYGHVIRYVHEIYRDAVFEDLFRTLTR